MQSVGGSWYTTSMKISVLTLFPDYFTSVFDSSILKRAQQAGVVDIEVIDIRAFATDKHQVTDDRPFGGGAGMVMKVEPIDTAVAAAKENAASKEQTRTVLTSAKGKPFTQETARNYAQLEHLILICGHYEGVDERVAEHIADEEVRIGEYVLTGGEPAVAVMVDAVVRLVPGALGNEQSLVAESHDTPGELGHPVYTRPAEYNGWKIPDILLSGDHKKIEEWRREQREVK